VRIEKASAYEAEESYPQFERLTPANEKARPEVLAFDGTHKAKSGGAR
jgi:hypothetical protein